MAVAIVLLLAAAVSATAQERDFAQVANPFQDGYPYHVGDDLEPNVEVDGVRWRLLRITTKGDRDIEPDKNVPITVGLEFENLRDDAVTVLVIVLLEDDLGNGLDRLRCDPPFKVAPGNLKELLYKFKVKGRNLLGTRSLYVFCELQE